MLASNGSHYDTLSQLRRESPRAIELLDVHHGLAGRVRDVGVERVLEGLGWRCVGPRRWARSAYSRGISTGRAIATEAAFALRAWLAAAGWRTLPDGSRIAAPSWRGVVAAARVEHALRAHGAEVDA